MSSTSSGGETASPNTVLTFVFSKNCNSYFYREFIRELSRDLKAKPKQSLSGGAKGTVSKTTTTTTSSQQQTNNRVLSLLSRVSAATNIGRQRTAVTPQNTFDSRSSLGSQGSPVSQRHLVQPQPQASQVRLSTLLRSNPSNDSDSDSDMPNIGGQGITITPQITSDSRTSLGSPASPRHLAQPQGSQLRLSTLLRSNQRNDSDSDTASV